MPERIITWPFGSLCDGVGVRVGFKAGIATASWARNSNGKQNGPTRNINVFFSSRMFHFSAPTPVSDSLRYCASAPVSSLYPVKVFMETPAVPTVCTTSTPRNAGHSSFVLSVMNATKGQVRWKKTNHGVEIITTYHIVTLYPNLFI